MAIPVLVSDKTKESTLCLFAKDDSAIGFHCRTCTAEGLTTAVFMDMFGVPFAAEHQEEVETVVAGLLLEGYSGFEDGWIDLRTGVDDIVSFFTAKMEEAKEEERFADQRRYEELRKRQTAEEYYATLCTALTRALGPAGSADVRGKIAYATAGGS